MLGHTWTDQRDRMLRSLKRLRGHYRNVDDIRDDLYHFFQDAWHLKDWIKNDPSAPIALKVNIEQKVKASRELRVCADLANGTKHMVLRESTKREGATISSAQVNIKVGPDSSISVQHLITLDDGSVTIAEEFADHVVLAWTQLIEPAA